MAFDSLSEKLQNVFKNLRSKGRLTEEDVNDMLQVFWTNESLDEEDEEEEDGEE